MSPYRKAGGASPAQLSYLKDLASQTGTTFTFPRSGYQAGREIERLKALKLTRGRCMEAPRCDVHPAELPYATEQKPGEVIGYGASARRADPAPRCAAPAPRRAEGEPFELGRYATRSGEQRALYGIRLDGEPRIIDAAADGQSGRIYTVEQDLQEKGGYGEVKALVADYLEQAQELGRIPMAKASRRREAVVADA
ncbi:MAG TPA: hypothetical protein VFW38_07710 [Solirubrobacteraceae bacterium]|nr:hypothetical protein [Solirubrobacteraceae bacterium]